MRLPVTVGSSAWNCSICWPCALCCAVACRMRPRFWRRPRAMASSSERSSTASVALPATSDPPNAPCVGVARFTPPGAASCCNAPWVACASAEDVAPGLPACAWPAAASAASSREVGRRPQGPSSTGDTAFRCIIASMLPVLQAVLKGWRIHWVLSLQLFFAILPFVAKGFRKEVFRCGAHAPASGEADTLWMQSKWNRRATK